MQRNWAISAITELIAWYLKVSAPLIPILACNMSDYARGGNCGSAYKNDRGIVLDC
jgi:hypothetical protein